MTNAYKAHALVPLRTQHVHVSIPSLVGLDHEHVKSILLLELPNHRLKVLSWSPLVRNGHLRPLRRILVSIRTRKHHCGTLLLALDQPTYEPTIQ